MGNCLAMGTPVNHYQAPTTTAAAASPEFSASRNNSSDDVVESVSNSGGGHSTTTSGETAGRPSLKIFKLADLKSATRNFRPDTVLGEGGFGTVYKGWIDERTFAPSKVAVGMPVAVKRSNSDSNQGLEEWQPLLASSSTAATPATQTSATACSTTASSSSKPATVSGFHGSSSSLPLLQGGSPSLTRRQWEEIEERRCYWGNVQIPGGGGKKLTTSDQAEVKFLGKFSHPNLVKLLGYCWEENQFLLVYEYMQKGSLESHLFRKNADPLPWEIRLKIATGAAEGLAFLHSSEKSVIYRDFKASNILLDKEYNAKLSDFGLAKFGPVNGKSHVTTRVMGTHGYAAPEYVATGHLYVKSDVYGFGVVLLEMLTGLRAMDTNRPSGEYKLVDWAKPSLSNKRKLRKIMDPRLDLEYPLNAAMQAAELILQCLEVDPKSRPSMEEVVETLRKVAEIKVKPREGKEGKSGGRDRRGSHGSHSYGHSPRDHHRPRYGGNGINGSRAHSAGR
ncbi:unnamed protein product [Linum tenue]|uniref:Protein kinase domain-containing protein n=1 Tax=Linum tenue TaxID=586396 RepID=A0AAV0HA07_9ROSI|nr:unnamed protein product [Linum tenue]